MPAVYCGVEACTGLGLTGISRLPRDCCGFALIHCGNLAVLGLMSRESRGYGMGCLRESRGVDELKFLADLRVITSDKEANKKREDIISETEQPNTL